MDTVKVVRCKDCRFSEDLPRGMKESRYCRIHDVTMRPDDFCSRGMDKGRVSYLSDSDNEWFSGQALELAKYIVTKCARDKKQISNLQLCHILYIIQRESLWRYGKRAFDDRFEAWAFGAVIVNVYYYFCGNGGMPIMSTYDAKVPENRSFVDEIVEKTRELEPWDLTKMAYTRGCAWEIIFDKGRGNRKIIPDDLMLRRG